MRNLTAKSAFEALGVYVRNYRWCWGGEDELCRPCLRVWDDKIIEIDGEDWVQVSHHKHYTGRKRSPGYTQRLDHLQLYREGRETLLLICTPRSTVEEPRHIKDVSKILFYAGNMKTIDGEQFMQMTRPELFDVAVQRMKDRKADMIRRMNQELASGQ